MRAKKEKPLGTKTVSVDAIFATLAAAGKKARSAKKEKRSVYDIVADKILAELDAGTVPWRKPWALKPGMYPQSVDGHRYRGINAILLGMTPYSDPRWITYNNAEAKGGQVRKDEKSTLITFWKFLEDEDTNAAGKVITKRIPLLRYYLVFNVEQVDGLNLKPLDGSNADLPFEEIPTAAEISANMPNAPTVTHDGGNRAFYHPATDTIHMPRRDSFESSDRYHATRFHEEGHATGHKSRLDRHDIENSISPFGSSNYGREELVAEFSAAFLCHYAGIENIEQNAAYIAGWKRSISADKRMVVVAAGAGYKAAEYILSGAPIEPEPVLPEPVQKRKRRQRTKPVQPEAVQPEGQLSLL
jgi:antirestriction protein ArdC